MDPARERFLRSIGFTDETLGEVMHMNEEQTLQAAEVAAQLLEVESKLKELEEQKKTLRDDLTGLLPPFEKGWKGTFGPAEVAWVAGRVTKTVDSEQIKRKLILLGVDIDMLNRTWEECTTEKTGGPTIRVTAAKEGDAR